MTNLGDGEMAKSKKDDEKINVADLKEQVKEIMAKAEELGVEHNFMFKTTFQRYVELISRMAELQKAIDEDGCVVTKEYVKGRQNLYIHPAVAAYNATAAQANNTATVLMKFILQPMSDGESKDDFDMF